VSSRSRRTPTTPGGSRSCFAPTCESASWWNAELQVPATSFDSYFGEQQLHFVKLDVEGAEAAVLRGMRRLLRAQRPVLAVEFHTEDGWAGRDELLDAGYRMESTGGEALDVGRSAPRVYQCLALPS
jgi:hypothetical protein